MFYLSIDAQHKADVAHMAYFPDEEPTYTDMFEELRHEKAWIPAHFHAAIDDGTIYRDRAVREAYYEWCEQVIAAHQDQCQALYKNRLFIANQFAESTAEVWNASLHDGEIVHVKRVNDTITLLLDMSGGFTAQAMIQLTFYGVTEEGKLARHYVYDELVETENGYGLRVLSGHPYKQWTIFFRDVEASFVYRPKMYAERTRYEDVQAYINDLTKDMCYYIVSNHQFVEIDVTQIEAHENGYFYREHALGETVEQVIAHIYCDRYEDPYAHFSEPVPLHELEQAALGSDKTLQVRAFNTMFEQGETHAPIVNRILRVIEVEEHEEMLIKVIAEHYDKQQLLELDVKQRWLL